MNLQAPDTSPAPRAVRQILANGVALLLAYVLPRVFTTVSVVLAARYLGPGDFGVYGTAAAWAVMLSILATLGMQPLLVREMARCPERAGALLRAAHLVKTGTNAVMLLTLFAVVWWAADVDTRVRQATLVLGLGYTLGAYAENLGAYYQAVERMHVWARASALFGFVAGAVGVGLLLATGSLVAFCWGPAVGWAAVLVRLAPQSPGAGPVDAGLSVGRDDVRELLVGLVPFAAAFIGVAVYSKVDVLLLARWRGDLDVGIYTAAYKFVDIFQALVVVAAAAVYPRLSRQAPDRGGRGSWAGARSTEIILLAAVPVGLGLHLFAGPATAILFGSGYAASVATVRVLGLLLPILAISVHGAYVLGAAGRMRPVALLYGLGIAVNLVLNRSLIPALGPQGAALARLSSEAVMGVGFLVVLHLAAGAAPGARASALAAAAAGLGGSTLLLPDATGGWIRLGVFSAGCALLYVLGAALGRGEVRALRSAVALRRAPPDGALGQGAP